MSPIETAKAFIAAIEKMDFDAASTFIAPDCEYTNLPMGTARGPEGVRTTLEPFFAPILENKFNVLRIAADGPTVFVERLDQHRLASGWFDLPITGVLEVRDGKIAVWREYFDLATLQNGMSGAAAAAA